MLVMLVENDEQIEIDMLKVRVTASVTTFQNSASDTVPHQSPTKKSHALGKNLARAADNSHRKRYSVL